MKFAISLLLFATLFLPCTLAVTGQEPITAQQSADDLRTQLRDVQAKEDALKAREQQLDEDLKPENIERSLAGIGSTRPEDLRELRRRQLNSEREGVRNQLRIVATNRERLEALLRTVDARAYHESAQGITPTNQMVASQNVFSARWGVVALAAIVAVLGIIFAVVMFRRAAIK